MKNSKELFKEIGRLVKVLGGYSWIILVDVESSIVGRQKEMKFIVRFFSKSWFIRFLKTLFIYFKVRKKLRLIKIYVANEFSTDEDLVSISISFKRIGELILWIPCQRLPELVVTKEERNLYPQKEIKTEMVYVTDHVS